MNIFEERKEWLKQRCGKITASEVHKLMKGGTRPMTEMELENRVKGNIRTTVDTVFGQGALTYIDEIVNGIISGGETKFLEGIQSIEWGFQYESHAFQHFVEKTGIDMEYFGSANPKFFKYNPVSGGSPDGLSEEHVGEIKCPFNGANHICALRGMHKKKDGNEWLRWFDEKYYAQVQFNMLACNRKKSHFISYDPRVVEYDLRIAHFEVKRDVVFQTLIKERIDLATDMIMNDLELFGILKF